MGKRLTIIGAGNAGLTAAYHLTHCGNEVCLYGSDGFDEQIDMIRERGGIRALSDQNGVSLSYPGFEKIDTLTKDIQCAVEYSSILIMPVPSFAQEILFRSMQPHLKDGQIIFLMPGNYGSLVLNRIGNESGFGHVDITFLDAISIPWACRIVGAAEIAILGMKKYLPVAAFPASKTDAIIDQLEFCLPLPLRPLKNVLAAGLENINFGGHPLLTVLNMGLLENFNGNFNFYRDCSSKSIARVVSVMEDERLAVGLALGLELTSELEAMNSLYEMNAASVYDINRNSKVHSKIGSAPSSSKHRYISEDVPYLLTPCKEFAQLAEIDTPILDACLRIASIYNMNNYFIEGRTLQKMGISEKSVNQIIDFVS